MSIAENSSSFLAFPRDRAFIYISAIPKSASSLLWLLVSALQEPDGRANPYRLRGLFPAPYEPLTPDIMRLFPFGGTYKSHAPADTLTIQTLRQLACPYIISTRHPADFIPALFCHCKADLGKSTSSPGFVRLLGEIPKSVFEGPIEAAMSHLINNGALDGILTWILNWLEFRDPEMSTVLRYEDLIDDFELSINGLSNFLLGRTIDADTMTYLIRVTKEVYEAGQAKSRSQYHEGWTGGTGIWRRYFSKQNIRDYNKVIERHIKRYDTNQTVLSVYPDLPISDV